jgi:hypothetical protein
LTLERLCRGAGVAIEKGGSGEGAVDLLDGVRVGDLLVV